MLIKRTRQRLLRSERPGSKRCTELQAAKAIEHHAERQAAKAIELQAEQQATEAGERRAERQAAQAINRRAIPSGKPLRPPSASQIGS